MSRSNKRLFDIGLIVMVCVLTVAALDLGLLPGAASHLLAMSLISWLMCSLPVAMLMGHCALSED